ncbi:MAG: Gfo/Idh/MocA family oxidoreductase [Propionibacteriaceae bacterium]|nr:Gfo/Idh/MocA family oxidoreductase [Propionibacteriaceae bacterium]
MFRVGVIGAGGVSHSHILGYLAFPGECEVVALCDTDQARAAARRDEFGLADARLYDEPGEMLASERLDVVSITTPPSAHAPIAIRALQAGAHVLVEKPMAPSLEDCDAMIAAAGAAGRLLGVVAQNRFRDDMATLKEVLDSGLIGPISHFQVSSAWSRGHSYYDLAWRGRWATEGGGASLGQAIHHLDLTLWLMGRPSAVTAVMTNAQHDNAEVEDLSVAILSYGSALAEITSSTVHHGEEQWIAIQGRDASVRQPWRAIADAHQESGFPAGHDDELIARLDALAAGHLPLRHTGHTGQIGDFLSAVRDHRRPAVDGVDGRDAVELVTAIYESAIEHRTIPFPLPPDDPYRRAGTLAERAPHFHEKTTSVDSLGGTITIGAAFDKRPDGGNAAV